MSLMDSHIGDATTTSFGGYWDISQRVRPYGNSTFSSQVDDWSKWAIDEVKRQFGNLGDNWDEYGAAAPSPRAAQFTINLIQAIATSESPLPRPIALSATPGGGFFIEWDSAVNNLEIEVAADTSVSGCYENASGDYVDFLPIR